MTKPASSLARVIAVLAAFFMCAIIGVQVANADTALKVSGTDYYGNGAIEKGANVSVLTVDGQSEDTVYIKLVQDGRTIGDRLPYEFGMTQNNQGGSTATGATRAGVVSLNIDSFDLKGSTYEIFAYADRDETETLYSGVLYGVYAKLSDGTEKLIGMHTGVAGEDASAISFKATQKVYLDGLTYSLSSDTPTVEGTKITYSYAQYAEAESVTGTVKFIDVEGNTIDEQTYEGITASSPTTVKIPAVVSTQKDGKTYYFRTVFFRDEITLQNPGQHDFTIQCKYIGDESTAQAGFYTAAIRAVDQDGNVVMTDTINVKGKYTYTLPSVIYKRVSDKVYAYKLVGNAVLNFDAAADGVSDFKQVDIDYIRSAADDPEVEVTFNLIDGTKSAGDAGRNLGKKTVTVTNAAPTAEPDEALTVNGESYKLAGTVEKYAYTYGSNSMPVVNVYYVPASYEPGDKSYTVTVNYVNFLTKETIKSDSFVSSESDNADHTYVSAEKFSQDGVDYVRLDGQTEPISHSYYSGIKTYTVYYRDVNDTLNSGTVITTIRVVYTDGTTGTTTTNGTAADGTQSGALNADGTYNVADGDGNNSTLTNEAGVDSNTERIEDDETPLASGLDGSQAGAISQYGWVLAAAVALATAGAVALWAILEKKQKKQDEE